MEYPKLEKEYSVHVYDTGPDGHLSLYALFNYFQDIASDHAVKLGYGRDELLKQNHFWVLSRIYAEITALPLWEEKIKLASWPRGTDKLFALRDFEMKSAGGQLLARATSSWLIIDRDSKRIQRPDNNLTRLNSAVPGEPGIRRNAEKIEPVVTGGQSSPPFTVRISDLDVNLHTNNTSYLNWVTDTYDLDFMLRNAPLSVEINYLSESRFNDTVEILTSGNDGVPGLFSHSVIRPADNSELCRVRILWKRILS
jgi:acyl-ACP thioesterase